ncbi:MAG: NAD(P)-dependent alcohol dehydrogenase [Phycisphaerales bacterium JB043]
MTTVHAWAAPETNAPLEPFEYQLPALDAHEVDIKVTSCGICHSDVSMIENAWGMSQYPLVPGHEAIGTVSAVGEHITHLKVGDTVGVGWHSGYCMTCSTCLAGDHNMCANQQATIVGRHGGFADTLRAHASSAIKIPDSLDPSKAGPMLCGGITVFNPFVQFDISPTHSVGVIGIGGLGHLALQFANAWGCHVTAFTSSESKAAEAIEIGAHDTLNSRDPQALEEAAGRFDLIISTVNVPLDWNAYLNALKPKGRLHVVGAVLEPLDIGAFSLIGNQRSVSGTPVGSPATIATMLDFAARHDIAPITEHFKISDVNDALEHLKSAKARYRIVLDV